MPRINPAIALIDKRLAEAVEEHRLCTLRCADIDRYIGTLRTLRDEAAQAVKKRKRPAVKSQEEAQP